MITQTIHEVIDKFDCFCKGHGHCLALFLVWGSVNSNPCFLVRQYHTGKMRVVELTDMLSYGNPSSGEQLIPEIPKEWKSIKGNVWDGVKDKKKLVKHKTK